MPVWKNFISSKPGKCLNLFPTIFRRVANPIQPFRFIILKHTLPLPPFYGICYSFWQRADPLNQPDDSPANELQCFHK
jgi:hypothetical protein